MGDKHFAERSKEAEETSAILCVTSFLRIIAVSERRLSPEIDSTALAKAHEGSKIVPAVNNPDFSKKSLLEFINTSGINCDVFYNVLVVHLRRSRWSNL